MYGINDLDAVLNSNGSFPLAEGESLSKMLYHICSADEWRNSLSASNREQRRNIWTSVDYFLFHPHLSRGNFLNCECTLRAEDLQQTLITRS
jgi:hypothetical protein